MKKILFVCLGNICRSPAANGVFASMIAGKNLAGAIACDSCGTGDWHIGQLPDARMRAAGARRGYAFSHRARQLRREDYADFDLIFAMDEENFRDLLARAPAGTDTGKIRRFADLCTGKFSGAGFVPDPYYGGGEDLLHAPDKIGKSRAPARPELTGAGGVRRRLF